MRFNASNHFFSLRIPFKYRGERRLFGLCFFLHMDDTTALLSSSFFIFLLFRFRFSPFFFLSSFLLARETRGLSRHVLF